MKKIIPFKWLPSAWGLRGKAFDEAEAYYALEGFELDMRLAEIKLSGKELAKAEADIRYRHGIVDEYHWMLEHIIAETDDPTQREVETIKLDMEFSKIEKREGEKKIAEILKEPWVSIVDEGLDLAAGPSGFYFVFDWNDHWIDLLRKHGYEGVDEDDLMEKWFTAVCRNEVMEAAPIPFNSGIVYE